jgi:hypothetical protein
LLQLEEKMEMMLEGPMCDFVDIPKRRLGVLIAIAPPAKLKFPARAQTSSLLAKILPSQMKYKKQLHSNVSPEKR